MKRVCVVVPAYNEAAVVADVIRESKKIFSASKQFDIDIIAVNDGSKDSTSSEARRGGAIVINHILNSGAGDATLTGLLYARQNKYDIAATMDADGQHDPVDVFNGIKLISESDVDLLIGSRLINNTGMSWVKTIGNRGLSLITIVLFSIKVTDSQSGLRIYSKDALQNLGWKSTGYEFCSEMLWRASQAKMTVGEYPVRAIYTDYSRAKGQNNWNAINIVKRLFKQRLLELFE